MSLRLPKGGLDKFESWQLSPDKSSSIRCYFLLVNISMAKTKCIHSFLLETSTVKESYWIRVFLPVTSEAEFSQTLGKHREKENCKVFHFMLLPRIIKVRGKLKNIYIYIYFEPFLPFFWGNKSFSVKSNSVFFPCFMISIAVQNSTTN